MTPQKIAALAVLTTCVGIGAAQAQSENSLQFSGDISAAYATDGTNRFFLGFADVTLRGPISGNLGLSVGLEAAVFDGTVGSQPYFALEYTMRNGTLSIGAPRFALDTHLARVQSLGNIKALQASELGLLGGTSSFARIFLLQSSSDVAFGARYDGAAGNLSYSASAHYATDFSSGGGAGIFQLGMTWTQGPIAVFGGAEHMTSGGGATGVNLGAEYTAEALKLGARVSHLTSSGGGDLTSYAAWAAYSVGQNLELTASVLGGGAGTTTLGGIAAKYSLSNGLYINGGVLSPLAGSANTVATLGGGIKF